VAAPNVRLLRAASATDLCLECHDGQAFAPDVLGPDTNALAERAAGLFGEVGVPNFRGHALGSGLSSDPNDLCNRCHFGGTMASAQVQCIDCHGPHGNGFYRNLQWASAPGLEDEIRAYTRPRASGLQRYEAGNVRYPAPALAASAWREVTNVCIDCHHAFMDDSVARFTKPGGMAHFGRHPGTNSEWGAFRPINASGANTSPDNWVSGSVGFDVPRLTFAVGGAGDFDAAGFVAPTNEVFCLTCHKAHGSEHPFALRWEYGDASAGRHASGCLQCHRDAQGQ
jgi:predicted CXXCH cytochrome family protein